MNNITTSAHNILSLLPYAENAQLVNKHQKLDDLYFVKAVVVFSINALKQFMAGKLDLFDAQVGENLCQIRACKILYLAKKWLIAAPQMNIFSQEINLFEAYKIRLDTVISEWECAINITKSFNKNLDSPENIHDFFNRHELLFDVSDDFIFIIMCFFLSHFNIRENTIPIAINLDYIHEEFRISKYRAKRLTHKYQQLVCALGCDFIVHITKHTPNASKYQELLPILYQISDENRPVYPCFAATDIIFHHLNAENTPILLVVHQQMIQEIESQYPILYFLITQEQGSERVPLDICQNYLQSNCLVVRGEVNYTYADSIESPIDYARRLLDKNPIELILANTASHPQYSGKKLALLRKNPFAILDAELKSDIVTLHEHRLESMQYFALQAGCSKEESSLFFLKHIYASTVKEELHKLKHHYPNRAVDAYSIMNIPNSND